MAKVAIGPLGVNASVPSDHKRKALPPRTTIKGWTPGAARRNARFLMTVDPKGLTGIPLAITLTTREIPSGPKDWAKRIDALFQWCRRRGMVRYHWVTEWQARGAPHLHAMVFFDTAKMLAAMDAERARQGLTPRFQDNFLDELEHTGEAGAQDRVAKDLAWLLVKHWWQSIAADLAASPLSQHVLPVTSIAGWCLYLSKHASRGVIHYQRQGGSLPPGWETSGRLWAKGGDWPTREDQREVDHGTLDRFKRLLARHQRAGALGVLRSGRAWGNQAQVRSAKGQLRNLARRGSGRAMDGDVRDALALVQRATLRGDQAARARHLEQLRQLRAKAGQAHRRAAAVRPISRHIPEALTRRLLDVAMDHAEGYEAPWLSRAERIAQARERHRAQEAQSGPTGALVE
jgi:hypothetical protein